MIDGFKGQKTMNRKGEWGQNLPHKLTIEGSEAPKQTKRKRAAHRSTNVRPNSPNGEETENSEPQPELSAPAPKRRNTRLATPAHGDPKSKSKHMSAKAILNELWKRRPQNTQHELGNCANGTQNISDPEKSSLSQLNTDQEFQPST